MNNAIKNALVFAIGAAVGSCMTWFISKAHYERIANEDAISLREYYTAKYSNDTPEKTETVEELQNDTPIDNLQKKPSINEYASMLKGQGYTNYSDFGENEDEDEQTDNEPYVISPDEFGERDGYTQISLRYYADEVLADDGDFLVDDVDSIVGSDSLNHFGDYGEEDSVFVRNDKLKIDYEILKDLRKYSDIVNDRHLQMED